LLGAETELGRAIAAALAEAGARVALVGATNDAEAAFSVQRLARKVGAEVSQAIDATNEAAVRVMVRQVSKALGGLDGVVLAPFASNSSRQSFEKSGQRFLASMKELSRQGKGHLILVFHGSGSSPEARSPEGPVQVTAVHTEGESPDDVAKRVRAALAAPAP
jgi:NADP-dependent 3-hydroxy acid dehydrogenase YdfG